MPQTLDGAIDSIVSTLQGISNIGKVVPYEKYIIDKNLFNTTFSTTVSAKTIIRGWVVTRIRTSIIRAAMPTRKDWSHTIAIRGFNGHSETLSSEENFQALVDSVLSTLCNLGSLSANVTWCGLPQLISFDHRQVCDVICHFAEIHIDLRNCVSKAG